MHLMLLFVLVETIKATNKVVVTYFHIVEVVSNIGISLRQ